MLIPQIGKQSDDQPSWCDQNGFNDAADDIHLSFSSARDLRNDLQCSSSDDDDIEEFEIHLPTDDVDQLGQGRMSGPPIGPTLRWASQQLLSLEDRIKLDAANSLLQMRTRSLAAKTATPQQAPVMAVEANMLDELFYRVNADLQQQMQRQEQVELEEKAEQSQRHRSMNAIAAQAEAAIAAFMRQQALERKAAEDAELERIEASRKEEEEKHRLQEASKKKAVEEANKKKALEAKAAADKAAAAEAHKKAQEDIKVLQGDTTTLKPVLKNRASYQSFAVARSKYFREVFGRVTAAPFNPDQKSFLEVNEILGRFAPSPSDMSPLDTLSNQIVSIVQKHDVELHSCNAAASFLKQVRNKVFQQPELASGFASLWLNLEQKLPQVSIFILAGLFSRCPPAGASLSPKKTYSSTQACTLRALLRVFTAYLQLSPGNFSFGWHWIASVLQLPPSAETATCVLTFLEVAEVSQYRFLEAYGKQGRKLVRYLAKTLLPKLPRGEAGIGSDVENLEAFLTPELIYKADSSGKGKTFILNALR